MRRSPVTAKRYDVGDGTMLTCREIAMRVKGATQQTIRNRVNNGWKGEALLNPLDVRRNEGRPRTTTAVIAYKLARKFGSKLPTPAEIRSVHPMAETTATYWRNAIREALVA